MSAALPATPPASNAVMLELGLTLKFCTIAESVFLARASLLMPAWSLPPPGFQRGCSRVVERLECLTDLSLRHPQRSLDLLAYHLPMLVRPGVGRDAFGVEGELHGASVIGMAAAIEVARRIDRLEVVEHRGEL